MRMGWPGTVPVERAGQIILDEQPRRMFSQLVGCTRKMRRPIVIALNLEDLHQLITELEHEREDVRLRAIRYLRTVCMALTRE